MTNEVRSPESKGLWFCKEDIEHHSTYLGTATSKGKGVHCPSPVEVFKTGYPIGAVPSDYLDKFPPESSWYEEIQRFKTEKIMDSDQMQDDYNAAINFALDSSGGEGLIFLRLWREGDWQAIEKEFPEFEISDILKRPWTES